MLRPIFGNGLVLAHSDETWGKKRKTLSSNFYKEKLRDMMKIVIFQTFQWIEEWKALK